MVVIVTFCLSLLSYHSVSSVTLYLFSIDVLDKTIEYIYIHLFFSISRKTGILRYLLGHHLPTDKHPYDIITMGSYGRISSYDKEGNINWQVYNRIIQIIHGTEGNFVQSAMNYSLFYIRVITKLPNSEQSYKGKVKTHKYTQLTKSTSIRTQLDEHDMEIINTNTKTILKMADTCT